MHQISDTFMKTMQNKDLLTDKHKIGLTNP